MLGVRRASESALQRVQSGVRSNLQLSREHLQEEDLWIAFILGHPK